MQFINNNTSALWKIVQWTDVKTNFSLFLPFSGVLLLWFYSNTCWAGLKKVPPNHDLHTPQCPYFGLKWVQKFSTLCVMRYRVMCRFCSGVESCIQFYFMNHFEGKIYKGRYVWCWNPFSNRKNKKTILWCVFHCFLFS